MAQSKIRKIATLKNRICTLKKRGKRIVFTNGCFDILHRGHITLLEKAKSFGDILVVGLNSNRSVKKIKGRTRPINSVRDRAIVLSALECVDYITVFNEPDPANVIKALSPDVLVKGGDWKKERIIGRDFVKSRGGKVRTVPIAKGYSTSRIINRINKATNG